MRDRYLLLVLCAFLLPGVLLRVVPHLDRLVGVPSVEQVDDEAVEVGLQLGLLFLFVRDERVRRVFAGLTRSRQVIAGSMCFLLATGFVGGTADTFPFFAWRMYSGDRASRPTVARLSGRAESGVVELDIEGLVPVLGRHRLHQRLIRLAERSDLENLHMRRTTMRSLAAYHNERNPEDPLREISLHLELVAVDAPAAPWLHRQPVERVILPPEPAR